MSVNSKIAAIADKGLFVFLCAAVGLAPIIYGSTDTIIVLNFEFASFIALVVFGIRLVLTGESLKFSWLLVPYVVFTLYVLIQVLPILPGWTPTGLGVDTSMLGSVSWHTISLDPSSTKASLVKLLSLGFYAFLTINLVNSKQRLNALVHVIIIVGVVLAILAIIQDFTWDGKIFWLRESAFKAFGPFVNKDHAAGYFELPFGLALGFIIGGGVRPDRKLIYAVFVMLLGAVIVLSKSRGGVVSLVGAAVVVVIFSSLSQSERHKHTNTLFGRLPNVVKVGFGVALLIVGIFAAAFWINKDYFAYNLGSFGDQQTYQHFGSRGVVWQATLDMAKQRPITGLGFGAYGVSFPRFSRLEGNLSTDYAHNDYLQILSDTGIVGSLIVLFGLGMFWIQAYKNTRVLKGFFAGVHLGAVVAIAAILIHSVFDFNLQIFSTALTFIVLFGLICAITQIWQNPEKYELVAA